MSHRCGAQPPVAFTVEGEEARCTVKGQEDHARTNPGQSPHKFKGVRFTTKEDLQFFARRELEPKTEGA